jgi:hypothetical protein
MRLSTWKNRQAMRRFALVLAAAAVAAPVAQATSFEDRGTPAPAPGYWVPEYYVNPTTETPDTFERWANNHSGAPASQSSPEAQALSPYADSVVGDSIQSSPEAQPDVALRFGPYGDRLPGDSTSKIELVRQSPRGISSPQATEAGFQWDDAAIGGGFALGLMLLGGAAFLATRHMSRPITA